MISIKKQGSYLQMFSECIQSWTWPSPSVIYGIYVWSLGCHLGWPTWELKKLDWLTQTTRTSTSNSPCIVGFPGSVAWHRSYLNCVAFTMSSSLTPSSVSMSCVCPFHYPCFCLRSSRISSQAMVKMSWTQATLEQLIENWLKIEQVVTEWKTIKITFPIPKVSKLEINQMGTNWAQVAGITHELRPLPVCLDTGNVDDPALQLWDLDSWTDPNRRGSLYRVCHIRTLTSKKLTMICLDNWWGSVSYIQHLMDIQELSQDFNNVGCWEPKTHSRLLLQQYAWLLVLGGYNGIFVFMSNKWPVWCTVLSKDKIHPIFGQRLISYISANQEIPNIFGKICHFIVDKIEAFNNNPSHHHIPTHFCLCFNVFDKQKRFSTVNIGNPTKMFLMFRSDVVFIRFRFSSQC